MNCKKCGKIHDGTYASGNFCSRSCANTRTPTVETRNKIRKTLIDSGRTGSFSVEARTKGVVVRLKNIQNRIEFGSFDSLKTFKHKRQRILLEQKQQCEICNCNQIHNEKPLTFQMDHIDGNRKNNNRENLRMICPNCHTQTHNWGSKNASSESKTKMGIVLNENGERIYFGRKASNLQAF